MGIMNSPALADIGTGIAFRPDANTVLWFPGQDDAYSSTIRDRSGQGNNGTITGATWKNDTPSGLWYLSYMPNNYVDCGTDSSTNFISGDFTLGAWIYKIGESNVIIFNRGVESETGFYFAVDSAERLKLITSQAAVFQQTTGTANRIILNSWMRVIGTRNGADAKLYYQGAEETSYVVKGSHTDPASAAAYSMLMGTWDDKATFPMDGYFALPFITGRVWTSEEVRDDFRQTRPLFRV